MDAGRSLECKWGDEFTEATDQKMDCDGESEVSFRESGVKGDRDCYENVDEMADVIFQVFMSLERSDDAEDFFCNAVSIPFVVVSHAIFFSGFLVKVFIGRDKKSAF